MVPINDEDIDPQLHALDEDPSMQFFACHAPQPASSHDDSTSEPEGQPDNFQAQSPAFQDFQEDEDMQEPKAHNLDAFSKMILQRKKLSDRATADFNIYCETEHVEERLALHYVLALENQDLLKELTKPEQWVISDDLKAISTYKGNASEHVLKAMQSLNVSGLPAENEVVSALTTFQNTMKTKIALSIQDGNKLRNIADLAHDLIRNTLVTATLQLYIRLAFLRFHVFTYKQAVDTWDMVDTTLVKWRKEVKSERDLTESFHNVYVADKAKYGDPSTTSHDVMQPRDVPGWLKTMDAHSCKVQGVVANKKWKHGHH